LTYSGNLAILWVHNLRNQFLVNLGDLDMGVSIGMATVLICDDDPSIGKLLGDICSDAGHEVISTTNAVDAMKEGLGRGPELMFIDVGLGSGDNGYIVCQNFKNDRQTSNSHIVIITARAGQTVEDAAKKVGADEVMLKPFKIKSVFDVIDRVLGEKNTSEN